MEKVNSKYYCEICNKYYKSINSLSNHKRKFHPKSQPKNIPWVTSGCPKVNISSYPNSIKNESGSKKFFCKFCGKNFSHKQSKYRHEKNVKII